MTIKIVVDSAMNIPDYLVRELDIAVVPVSVIVDGTTYRENVDASRSEMVNLIAKGKRATTSQPAPGDFVEVYQSFPDADLISVHITGKLSGTLQTAVIASQMVGAERIHTFDSESASMGGGWLAVAAALAAKRGESVPVILALLEKIRPQITTLLSMPTLKYLQRGGRVNLAKSLLASLLSLKPILAIQDGLVVPVSKARSMPAAIKEMALVLKEKHGDEPVALAVMHADDEPMGQQLLATLQQALRVRHHLFLDLTASLVVHGGPGTIGAVAIPFKYVKDLLK